MITGRFEQIAFGNRKENNKHRRGRRENPSLSDSSMRTLTPIHCNHRRNTMCTSSRSKRTRRFPAELRQTTAKNAKLPSAGPASTGASSGWTKPTVLKHQTLQKGPFDPKSGDSSRDNPAVIAASFSNFQL